MNPAPTPEAGARTAIPRTYALLLAIALALLAPALRAPAADAAQAPRGFFGVHPRSLDGIQASDYVRMAAADVGLIRTGFIIGRVKDSADDPYNWSHFDKIVAETARNGIDLLPVLLGVPPYVTTKPGSVPLGNSESEWRDYLRELVLRYGPDGQFWIERPEVPEHPIRDWQIWNEQNALTNWKMKPNPREYGRLLAISAETIHEVDAEATIVAGGVISTPGNPLAPAGVKYLRKMLRSSPAAKRAADVIAIHPYTGYVKDIKEQVRKTREMLDDLKLDLPIWITEIGWGTGSETRNPLIVSEARQRQNLRKAFEMMIRERRKLGIGRAVWYQWRDGPDEICKWCVNSGLVQQNGVSKPLLDVFSRIARL